MSPAALPDNTCKTSVSHDVGVYDDYFTRGEFKSTGEALPAPKPLPSPLKSSAPAACHGQLQFKNDKNHQTSILYSVADMSTNFLICNDKFW